MLILNIISNYKLIFFNLCHFILLEHFTICAKRITKIFIWYWENIDRLSHIILSIYLLYRKLSLLINLPCAVIWYFSSWIHHDLYFSRCFWKGNSVTKTSVIVLHNWLADNPFFIFEKHTSVPCTYMFLFCYCGYIICI